MAAKKWTKVELALIKIAAFEIKYLRIPKALEMRVLKLVLRNRTVEAIDKKLRAALNG
jgi:hypothetical protein